MFGFRFQQTTRLRVCQYWTVMIQQISLNMVLEFSTVVQVWKAFTRTQ